MHVRAALESGATGHHLRVDNTEARSAPKPVLNTSTRILRFRASAIVLLSLLFACLSLTPATAASVTLVEPKYNHFSIIAWGPDGSDGALSGEIKWVDSRNLSLSGDLYQGCGKKRRVYAIVYTWQDRGLLLEDGVGRVRKPIT